MSGPQKKSSANWIKDGIKKLHARDCNSHRKISSGILKFNDRLNHFNQI